MFLSRLQHKHYALVICLLLVLLAGTASISTLSRSNSLQAKAATVNRPASKASNGGTFNGCPPQGNGGDTELNLLKNREDTASWNSMPWSQLANLPYPKTALHKDMSTWSSSDAAQIAKYNGHPVSVTGYLAGVRPGSPEPANCNSSKYVDYHLYLGNSPTAKDAASIVTEATPRIRAKHPGWTLARLQFVASHHLPVNISGWTMFDPADDGPRVGPWEIHPVMQIMVRLNGAWVSLDSAKL
ncbi:MAG: hypothetical protein NVS3B14_10900 [Ktedonobacteraceae bacterium]